MFSNTLTTGRNSAVASGNSHERKPGHQAHDEQEITRGSKAHGTTSSQYSKRNKNLTANQKALLEAAKYGNKTVLIKSLAHNPNDLNTRCPISGKTALHESIRWGHTDVTNVLLEYNPALDITDSNGFRPIHEAAKWGRTDTLIKLLKAGADINAKSKDNWSALNLACKFGNFDTVSGMLIVTAHLKNLELEINDTNNRGQNALHLCILSLNSNQQVASSLARELIIAGVNPAKMDEDGSTPLHLSGEFNMPTIATALLRTKAVDVDAINKKGETPLMVAARQGSYETASRLLNNNADINKQDNDGNTPLIIALKHMNVSTANLLMSEGNPDLSLKNKWNQTAIRVAHSNSIVYNPRADLLPPFQCGSSPPLRYIRA